MTFEYQRLPIGTNFTEEVINFMKNNTEFIQYYHNYYHEGALFTSFRDMVHERMRLNQILKNNSLY
jgi:hypothetical protein